MPLFKATRVTARIAAFIPGASPPEVKTPIRLTIKLSSIHEHNHSIMFWLISRKNYLLERPFSFFSTLSAFTLSSTRSAATASF